MAEIDVEPKRKRKGSNNNVILKRLKVLEDKQDKFIFAFGKMMQVVLKTHQMVQQIAPPENITPSEKKGCHLASLFSKTSSKTGLTRPHIYTDMMCSNVYPTDVELCTAFLAKREGVEAKEVKKWWNLHRHKIIKFKSYHF